MIATAIVTIIFAFWGAGVRGAVATVTLLQSTSINLVPVIVWLAMHVLARYTQFKSIFPLLIPILGLVRKKAFLRPAMLTRANFLVCFKAFS